MTFDEFCDKISPYVPYIVLGSGLALFGNICYKAGYRRGVDDFYNSLVTHFDKAFSICFGDD